MPVAAQSGQNKSINTKMAEYIVRVSPRLRNKTMHAAGIKTLPTQKKLSDLENEFDATMQALTESVQSHGGKANGDVKKFFDTFKGKKGGTKFEDFQAALGNFINGIQKEPTEGNDKINSIKQKASNFGSQITSLFKNSAPMKAFSGLLEDLGETIANGNEEAQKNVEKLYKIVEEYAKVKEEGDPSNHFDTQDRHNTAAIVGKHLDGDDITKSSVTKSGETRTDKEKGLETFRKKYEMTKIKTTTNKQLKDHEKQNIGELAFGVISASFHNVMAGINQVTLKPVMDWLQKPTEHTSEQ